MRFLKVKDQATKEIDGDTNPVCTVDRYQSRINGLLMPLEELDGVVVTDDDREGSRIELVMTETMQSLSSDCVIATTTTTAIINGGSNDGLSDNL